MKVCKHAQKDNARRTRFDASHLGMQVFVFLLAGRARHCIEEALVLGRHRDLPALDIADDMTQAKAMPTARELRGNRTQES